MSATRFHAVATFLADARTAAIVFLLALGLVAALPAPATASECYPETIEGPMDNCDCEPFGNFVPCGCCWHTENHFWSCVFCQVE
jgi:hypothetical protein